MNNLIYGRLPQYRQQLKSYPAVGRCNALEGQFFRLLLVMAILISAGTGCAPTKVKKAQNISSAAATFSTAASNRYVIYPGDELDIKFFNVPELNDSVKVRPDGQISLELAHDIKAAGLSPSELGDAIRKAYSTEINNVRVTVIVRNFTGQRVYVQGEVSKPDLIALAPNMTVLQAISASGGLTSSASAENVVLIRRSENNRPVAVRLDLASVLDGDEGADDVALQPFDIVHVPRSRIANLNLWVDQYLRKNIPINIGFAYGIGE